MAGDEAWRARHAGLLTPVAAARASPRLLSLLPMLADQRTVWLAGGTPPGEAFPLASLRVTTVDGACDVHVGAAAGGHADKNDEAYKMQQYQMVFRGYPPLFDWVCAHVRLLHAPPEGGGAVGPAPLEERVLLTCGNSDALDKVLVALLGPGDVLLVEESNFLTSISALRPHQARGVTVAPVRTHCARAVRDACAALRARGLRPKVYYVIPTAHNPTGVSASADARRAIYAAACDEDLLLLEDDPYLYAAFGKTGGKWLKGADAAAAGESANAVNEAAMPGLYGLASHAFTTSTPNAALPPSYLSMDVEERVVRVDTFSKFMAPGLRAGWVTCCHALRQSLMYHTQQSSQGVCSVSSVILANVLQQWGNDGLDAHLRRLQAGYASKCALLLSLLEEHCGELARAEVPDGGMFAWIKVSWAVGVVDTAELIDDLVAARVALVPGRFFSPDDAPSQHLRACFATASPAEIALGMERLGMALKKRARAGGAHRPSLTRVRGAVHQNKRVRTQHALAI